MSLCVEHFPRNEAIGIDEKFAAIRRSLFGQRQAEVGIGVWECVPFDREPDKIWFRRKVTI